ncbi:hypothetical protein ABZ297_28465 [Nonomuraea sp. NPDC005983]|uniref:TetR/AcrR family transcriptional regulator n=1 Tax=Nonomuraea sp. NPDC005983 TaxID=3155595 RepID=UPI0033BD38C1
MIVLDQHWFGSKEGLFAEAVINVPFDLNELVERLLDGNADDLGRRMVRTFLTNCDTVGGGVFVALLRSVTSHEQAGHALHDFMIKHIVVRVLYSVEVDQPEFRATLVAAQLAGLGVIRYVTEYEPLASAEIDKIVAAVAPTVQRYITGDIA